MADWVLSGMWAGRIGRQQYLVNYLILTIGGVILGFPLAFWFGLSIYNVSLAEALLILFGPIHTQHHPDCVRLLTPHQEIARHQSDRLVVAAHSAPLYRFFAVARPDLYWRR